VRLALIHQSPGDGPHPRGAAVWQTCLRDVLFVRDLSHDQFDHRIVTDADAYAVLLEVVCGLRSPLSGETEVQSQFKSFLGSLDPHLDRDLLRVGQRVLSDAKAIRQRYLQGVGVVAYGALAARLVPNDRLVVLLGTGVLAADLLDALAPRHTIEQWGRRQQDGRPRYSVLSTAASSGVRSTAQATLIVAAPVPQRDVDAVGECYPHIREIVDLRGRHERTPSSASCRVFTLDDLFREAAQFGPAVDRIADARRDIRERSRAFADRDELRPFGWDDLCA
jgi:glutamyl-tRNA reductase